MLTTLARVLGGCQHVNILIFVLIELFFCIFNVDNDFCNPFVNIANILVAIF